MQRLDASDLDSSKLNVKPTWGISFGLPQTGGPYPVNPYGGNALVNPYGGYGLPEQGINFGLLSVNPLLAVQFTKDEYGEKVVKPFVNFHVTPNRNAVQKLGHLLAHKKQLLYGNYAANYAVPSKPYLSHEKPHYAGPSYPPYSYTSHREPSHPNEYSDYYRDGNDYDYDYDYDHNPEDHSEHYYDRARSNNDRDIGSTGKVSFPSRRKRDARSLREQSQPRPQLSRLILTGNTTEVSM